MTYRFAAAAASLMLAIAPISGQERLNLPKTTTAPPNTEIVQPSPACFDESPRSPWHRGGYGQAAPGYLTGNVDFPNFIGFISNPLQSIDPRAVTTLWPLFGSSWVDPERSILPSGNMQVYGAGMNVALSDRLSFGLNQGGYAVARFNRERETRRAALGLPVRAIDRGGEREGWLNLGGFVQYTLIADVPNQFLLTAGMRWEAPTGATQLFQGSGPAYLAPYLTVGKEIGCYHILATTGYEFPAGSGDSTTNTYYFNLHLDRKIGCLYPLLELNYAHRTANADINLQTPRHGLIDLGTFTTTGDSLTVALGANAVLIPGKLELGGVYFRPVVAPGNFELNGMLIKMSYRY